MKGKVLALSGGVGGAKLALGLSRVIDAQQLTIVVNIGDDFRHLGLAISPDIDTLMYTLAGLADPVQGWGRRDETWNFMAALDELGGENWFRLGDADLAMHVERTRRLAAGESLSAITDTLRRRLGIVPRIVPASDDALRTRLLTDEGWLDFQDYFVRRRCAPAVRAIDYGDAARAGPSPGLLQALGDADLRAVVVCPSNPFLSIDPVLAVPGIRAALAACAAPVVAVSPLIGGRAVKGPTAKMMAELGLVVSNGEIARHYKGLIDALVVDGTDAQTVADIETDVQTIVAPTLMHSLEDRERLARAVLATADRLAAASARATRP